MFDKFVAADDLALVVHEVGQQLVLLCRQLDRLPGKGDTPGPGVETNVTGGEFAGSVAGSAADQRAQSGYQLFGLERLGQITVAPYVKPGHLGGPVFPCGEDKNREVSPIPAPHSKPRPTRKPPVVEKSGK